MAAHEALLEKTPSTGAKIDIVLAIIRIQMFFDDKYSVQKNIERAHKYGSTLPLYEASRMLTDAKACRERWRLGPP